jgi:membrane fusion protein (multidrug efflux system)
MDGKPSIFRKEAVEQYHRSRNEADILRISPAWSRWLYWVLVSVFVTGLLFCILAPVDEYASGLAVVRFEGRVELTSHEAGLVSSVAAQPGQRVRVGEPLVTFAAQEESAVVERLRREHESRLVRFLREPSHPEARQALSQTRTELELAEARLTARSLRAPCDGVITDVRASPGQYLSPGAGVVSIVPADAPPTLLALLPGYYRPHLRPGASLRIELAGFRHEYQELRIDQVGDQLVGPAEVRRFLGPGLSDAFALEGPLVLVRARLPSRTFLSEGDTYEYFDGMPARAEARVRTERLLLRLVPGLRELRFWND